METDWNGWNIGWSWSNKLIYFYKKCRKISKLLMKGSYKIRRNMTKQSILRRTKNVFPKCKSNLNILLKSFKYLGESILK